MMVLSLRVVFVLSSYVIIINNLHASYGETNTQAYQVSSLYQILTPSEKSQYLENGILPSRVYYDYTYGAYVVKGQNEARNNQPPAGYTVMPRWKYWLTNIPLVNSLFGKGSGGSKADAKHPNADDDDDKAVADDNDDKADADDNDDKADADDNDDKADADDNDKKADEKNPDADDNDNKAADKEPDADDTDNKAEDSDDNTEKKETNDDKKDDENEGGFMDGVMKSTPVQLISDALTGDKAEFVKDVVTSEMGQEAIKMGIELLPGGAAMLRAYETGQKLNSATGFTDKMSEKFKAA